MAPRDHVLTLLTRPGCHLCGEAREVLAKLSAEVGVAWHERDITADADDMAEYGDRVPVLLFDGREHGYWHIDEDRIRRDLVR